jgi:tetratricopeptide (TPR) repeat protein
MPLTTSAHRLLIVGLLLGSSLAQAQLFRDPTWQGWLDGGRTSELERAAQERLKAQPADPQASLALALAALDEGSPERLESSIPLLQACVERQAQALCHYGLGRVYGQQAMSASLFRLPGLASKTKEQLLKAVESDPMLYDARSALLQFYLMAPGMAGGSVPKAKELAAQAEARQPEHARLLRSLIASHDGDLAAAERELAAVRPGEDRALQRELRGAWMQLGAAYIEAKNWVKARSAFETVQREHPGFAGGPYGLGRVALEQGQNDEALKALERARGLELAERFPIDHRIGIALMNKGDKAAAKAALERFVTSKRANPRNLEDARKRLAQLA